MPFHKILNEYREKLRIMAEEHGAQIVDLQSEFDKTQKSIKTKRTGNRRHSSHKSRP